LPVTTFALVVVHQLVAVFVARRMKFCNQSHLWLLYWLWNMGTYLPGVSEARRIQLRQRTSRNGSLQLMSQVPRPGGEQGPVAAKSRVAVSGGSCTYVDFLRNFDVNEPMCAFSPHQRPIL
jgi:hypothetical protein